MPDFLRPGASAKTVRELFRDSNGQTKFVPDDQLAPPDAPQKIVAADLQIVENFLNVCYAAAVRAREDVKDRPDELATADKYVATIEAFATTVMRSPRYLDDRDKREAEMLTSLAAMLGIKL